MALWTPLDVDACQATQHGRGGCIGQREERGLRKQAAAYRDPGRTTAIAQYAIVANTDEPFGDHMEQLCGEANYVASEP